MITDKNKEVAKLNLSNDRETVIGETSALITKKVEFGEIRIAGEKDKRRISFKTLSALNSQIKLGNYDKIVIISELGIRVRLRDIVFQEVKYEIVEEWKDFAKLPTESVILDSNLKPVNKTLMKMEKARIKYAIAKAHYRVVNGADGKQIKSYILDMEKIPEIVFINFDRKDTKSSGMVVKILRYGERQTEPELSENW